MEHKTNILIDFETLNLNPNNCAVLRFSYLLFDFDNNNYNFDEILNRTKSYNLSVEDQVQAGAEIDKTTLKFWEDTLPTHLNLKNKLTLEEFFSRLEDDLRYVTIDRWWSRNNIFDPIIFYRLVEQTSLDTSMKVRFKANNVRDVRTFMDAIASENTAFEPNPFNFNLKNYIKYDSSHEITLDYLNMNRAYQLLNDLS